MKLVGIGVACFFVILGLVLWVMKAWRRRVGYRPHNIFQVPFFKTGDLVLANLTPMVPEFTRAKYHHTGIIYVHPETQQILVWHTSRYMEAVDPFVANFHPLHMFCRIVKGRKLGIRRLLGGTPANFPPPKWSAHYQKHTVMDLDIAGRVLAQALKQLPLGNHLGNCSLLNSPTRAVNTLACVDLTTLTYIEMGVLSPQASKMELLTEDYCGGGTAERLPFTNGFSLAPEITVLV